MAVEVKLPRLGQGMEAGTIVRWLKAEGEPVAKGEPLYELDTDKVTQEVEAEAEGVLLKIVVPEGEVEVGRTIAVIGGEGEDVSALLEAAQGGDGEGPVAGAAPAARPAAELASEAERPAAQAAPTAAPAEAPAPA
ncbi:MAG TPA: biotin/lipoyl-containing protein, partial [Gaiellaceae bacterium]|nr:biotin/lipoyl-containing protein [Gaiellaceae bacterium]